MFIGPNMSFHVIESFMKRMQSVIKPAFWRAFLAEFHKTFMLNDNGCQFPFITITKWHILMEIRYNQELADQNASLCFA